MARLPVLIALLAITSAAFGLTGAAGVQIPPPGPVVRDQVTSAPASDGPFAVRVGIEIAIGSNGRSKYGSPPSNACYEIDSLCKLQSGWTSKIITYDSINTTAKLANYDVIVTGDVGYGDNDFLNYQDTLKKWVRNGGGLVTLGWCVYGISGKTAYQMDSVCAVKAISNGYGYVTSGTVHITNNSHPITTGVSDFNVQSFGEYANNDTWPGATRLGNYSGATGYSSIACRAVGSGKAVYLGPIYFGTFGSYGDRAYYSDANARLLLKQAIEWAGTNITHNVGVSKMLAPTGTMDSSASVTPACSVFNSGSFAETYKVRLRIGAYRDSATVASHAAGTSQYVTFASWTAGARGTIVVSCSTELAGDANSGNDKRTDSVKVGVKDVGVTRLMAPTGAVDSGTAVTPACSVYNWGTAAASCSVRMRIGAGYARATNVASLAAGARGYVTFPNWTATERGSNAVSCSTELTGDLKTADDKLTGTVTVNVTDVGTKIILAPAGSIVAGTVVTPACSVYNYGTTTPATYTVRMKFQTYSQTATVTSHAPGATVYVTFPNWTSVVGTWPVSCSTVLAADAHKTNDKLTGQVIVTAAALPPGWHAMSPMPAGAKAIKDGGWLAYDAGKARIYASRGNKAPDFYSYNPANDSWKVLAPWLPGTEGKLPGKGSAGCADGNGNIYATKGNNKSGFWKYDANANAWTQKKDVPLGVSNKRVKGGTSITWAVKGSVGSPYLLKGYKNEFYRYDVGGDSWQTLTPAPVGSNQKWDKGSWVAWEGDSFHRIYAFKAKYMEFYSYNTDTDSWSAALASMPAAGSAGSKKAKDGSCGAWIGDFVMKPNNIFSLKGGNTREFWQYNTTTNSWVEKETIPTGAFKKKVKSGAGIVAAGSVLYATKGNKSNEFWQYTPSESTFEAPRHDGVVAGRLAIDECRLAIAPNPLATGFAVLRYGLPKAGAAELNVYNVAGQTVMAQTLTAGRSGTVNLDLRHLSNGVYLVKLSSEGFVNSQKLVVQR